MLAVELVVAPELAEARLEVAGEATYLARLGATVIDRALVRELVHRAQALAGVEGAEVAGRGPDPLRVSMSRWLRTWTMSSIPKRS